jgi:hypothetical protein
MIMARPKKRDDDPIEFPPSLLAIIALEPMAKKHQVLDTCLRLWASPLYGQRKFWVLILISVWFYTFGTIIWLLHSCPDFMASNDEFALNLDTCSKMTVSRATRKFLVSLYRRSWPMNGSGRFPSLASTETNIGAGAIF